MENVTWSFIHIRLTIPQRWAVTRLPRVVR